MSTNVVEISVDIPPNRDWFFPPLDRTIRGRFLLERVAEPTAMSFQNRIPRDIPGQVVGVDLKTGEGYITEPIHELPAIRNDLEGKYELAPARETFPHVNPDEWLYWMKRAVDVGAGTVITGELPETVDFKPKPFGQVDNKREKLVDALIAVLYAQLDDGAKQQVAELVGA